MQMNSKQHGSAKERSHRYIAEYIEKHRLAPGDKLPTNAEWCAMMGVSLFTVRETLKYLEAQGKIKIVNGKGSYLAKEGCKRIVISAQIADSGAQKRLIEIFEMRKLLEGQVIASVIKSATPTEIERMQNRIDQMMFKYHSGASTMAEDRLFHAEFYRSCHNDILQELTTSLMYAFIQMYPNDPGSHEFYDDTIPLHEEMFRYVLDGNTREAVAANDKMMDQVLVKLTNATTGASAENNRKGAEQDETQ